jgi:integrase
MSKNPPALYTGYDLSNIDYSRKYFRVEFTHPNPPPGEPKRQRAATNIPNDGTVANLEQIVSIRNVLFRSLNNGMLSDEVYCSLLPDSAYAKKSRKEAQSKNITYSHLVNEFEENLLPRIDQGRMSPRTLHEYIASLRGRRCSSLLHLSSQEITEKAIRDLQRSWESRREDGSMRSTKTIRNLISAVTQLLQWSSREGYIEGQPWLAFERQVVEAERQAVFSHEAMIELYKDMYLNECPDAANLFAILCLTGCRVSEAIAICTSDDLYTKYQCISDVRTRQSDVNFSSSEDPRLKIRRGLVTDKVKLTAAEREDLRKRGYKNVPKTRSIVYWKRTKTMDTRDLELSPVAVEILQEQIQRTDGDPLQTLMVKSRAGDRLDHVRPLFLNRIRGKKGIWLGSDSVRKMYHRAKQRLGYGTIRPDLPPLKNTRNTKASSMACQGDSAIKIREQLGHGRDTETIERHYINYYPELKDLNVEKTFEQARTELKQLMNKGSQIDE